MIHSEVTGVKERMLDPEGHEPRPVGPPTECWEVTGKVDREMVNPEKD